MSFILSAYEAFETTVATSARSLVAAAGVLLTTLGVGVLMG